MTQADSCRSKGDTRVVDAGTPRFFSSVIGSAICPVAALPTACAHPANDGKSDRRGSSRAATRGLSRASELDFSTASDLPKDLPMGLSLTQLPTPEDT